MAFCGLLNAPPGVVLKGKALFELLLNDSPQLAILLLDLDVFRLVAGVATLVDKFTLRPFLFISLIQAGGLDAIDFALKLSQLELILPAHISHHIDLVFLFEIFYAFQ